MLAGAFFALFVFFGLAVLAAFFAGLAAVLVDVLAAAVGAVDDAAGVAAAAGAVDGLIAFFAVPALDFGFDAPAAFFFGDAAFFFGLLALALPAAFGLAAAFALGLAI